MVSVLASMGSTHGTACVKIRGYFSQDKPNAATITVANAIHCESYTKPHFFFFFLIDNILCDKVRVLVCNCANGTAAKKMQ